MIDAHAVDHPLRVEAEDQSMGRFKCLGIVHPQTDEFVDVEEATPVDLVIGDAPPGEAVVLARQNGLEPFVSMELTGQRETMLEIFCDGLPAIVREADLATAQRITQRLAEDRKQYLPAQCFVVDIPIDIEIGGVTAGAAVAQHVEPPYVPRVRCHVVRHDVNNEAHGGAAQHCDQAPQRIFTAELRVDALRINNVIAVRRTRSSRGYRGGIEKADAEAGGESDVLLAVWERKTPS